MKNLMEKEFNRHIESVHEGNKPYERNLWNAANKCELCHEEVDREKNSIGILNQIMRKINHMEETFRMHLTNVKFVMKNLMEKKIQ